MRIAFYKAPTTLFDKLIRFWEAGLYSHCEVVLAGPTKDGNYLIASSEPGIGVRKTYKKLPDTDWDFLDIDTDAGQVNAWFNKHDGCPYDYKGILGFIFRPIPSEKRRFFCSEAVGLSLGIPDAWRYDPNTLYSTLKYKGAV